MEIKAKNGFKVAMQANKKATFYLSGDVIQDINGEFLKDWNVNNGYICPADVIKALNECEDGTDIDVHINSNGGDVQAGLAIANMLNQYNKGTVTCYVDGWAASIASVIALNANKCVMPENTFLMIHYPMCGMYGNIKELEKGVEDLRKITDCMIDEYDSHAICDRAEIIEMLENETWLSAKDCTEKFKNIEMIPRTDVEATAYISDKFTNVPTIITDMLKAKNKKADTDKADKEKFINDSVMKSICV